MSTWYRLHIEGDTAEPTRFATMGQIRTEQRRLAREYGRTIAEIEAMSYIVTEDEYRAEQAEGR